MSTEQPRPTLPEAPRSNSPDYSEEVDVRRMHAAIARENEEPHDGFAPVPLWMVAIIGVIVFVCGAYFMTYSGGFSGMYYDTVALGSPALAAGGAAAKVEDPVALGQTFFTTTCVSCHQATGLGLPGAFPPLVGSEYVTGDEKRLAAIVLHGVQGPITVAGQTYNSQMQAWGTTLNDKKIAAILTYIRQAWGNKAPPVSLETVAQVRKATASRTAAWTEAELKAFK